MLPFVGAGVMFANATAQVMDMNENADEKLYSSGVLLVPCLYLA